jgi:RNA polymerase subunit RPABC4/transcription elongation factor Spt4
MTMVRCKECGAIISDKAKSCPVCGDPKKDYIGAAFYIGLLVLIFLGVKSCIGGSLDRAEKLRSSEQYQAPKERSSLVASGKTPSVISDWKKNPAQPKDLNAQELKEYGKDVCNEAVSEKLISDFYEGCYKNIIESIKIIENSNLDNKGDVYYTNYIYPACYYTGRQRIKSNGHAVVNANAVRGCLHIESLHLKFINAYADKFGEDKVYDLVKSQKSAIEARGSWFPAYKKLGDVFGPVPQ